MSKHMPGFILNILNVIYGFCATISLVTISYVIAMPILMLINTNFSLPYRPDIALAVNAITIVIVYLITNKLEKYENQYYNMDF